jgi:hypothetical protein
MILVILNVMGIIQGMDNGSQATWSSFFEKSKTTFIPKELKQKNSCR